MIPSLLYALADNSINYCVCLLNISMSLNGAKQPAKKERRPYRARQQADTDLSGMSQEVPDKAKMSGLGCNVQYQED